MIRVAVLLLTLAGCSAEQPQRVPTTDAELGIDWSETNVDQREQADSDARHHAEREPLW